MEETYAITATQLQNALGLLQLWKDISMRPGQKRYDVAYNSGCVNGMVLALAMIGFPGETKKALGDALREYFEQQKT